MQAYSKPVHIRWSDLDPNFHLRHSAYYDMAAMVRNGYLEENGLTLNVLKEQHFGPVIFREECVFRKEIMAHDKISIRIEVIKLRKDFSRWSIRNLFLKEDGTLAAILTVEGAWMDTRERKLTAPPSVGADTIANMAKAEDFVWE